MPARRFTVLLLLLSVGVFFSLTFTVDAQSTAQAVNTCPDIVNQSLLSLGTSCASADPNTTCYGHPEMNVAAFTTAPAPTYNQPGNRVPLSQVEAIQTGPLNLNTGNWGLNLMNVSANIPTALSQKGVVFVQFGGVEVESAVDPGKAVSGLTIGIPVTTATTANLLTWPEPSINGHASNLVTSLPAGAPLSVDAISPGGPNGPSVRAVYTDPTLGPVTGWVLKSALITSVDLSSLPVIGPDDLNYFQSFYYRTGIGLSTQDCAESTSLLFVQGPKNAPTDLKVFDQSIRIESTIVLLSLPAQDTLGNELELIDLTGLLILYPDTPQQIIVPPGFKTTIKLGNIDASLGIQGDADEKTVNGTFTPPVPLTQNELDGLKGLEDIPSNDTNYPIKIPIIIQASGSGNSIAQLVFPDPSALDQAKKACAAGLLPQDICQYLGIV